MSVTALDGPGFQADPSVLLAAARSADTAGHDAVVLLSEAVYLFEDDGRSHSFSRLVVTVTTPAGAQDWTSWWCTYRPWREDKPVLRARVITPDGKVHPVDPRTVEESAAAEQEGEMYSDARRIRAPLPAVVPGAVLEQECEHREKRPAIDGLMQSFHLFGLAAPVLRTRVVLDAPSGLPLRTQVRRLPSLSVAREESGGRVRQLFTMGRMEATGDGDPLLPPDVAPRPYLAWSAVGSWAEVARHYHKLVEDKLAGPQAAELAEVARAVVRGVTGRAAVIAALLAKVQQEVRFVGVELGDGAIVPRPPLEVLHRRFGDCKDQATLLVGLLRAAGIEARVALLRSGTGFDVERELPDLGSFNHAIVWVAPAGGEPALWIDPTDRFARAGQLPIADQGRWALLVGGDGKLVQTPLSTARDNTDVEEREVILAEAGRARVVESSTMRGSFESSLRARAAIPDDKKLRDSLAAYMEQEYAADRFDRFEVGDPDDFSKPMHMRLEASEARCGVSGGDPSAGGEAAEVAIAEARIATPYLPPSLRDAPPEGDTKGTPDVAAPGRAAEVYFPEPFTVEWRYRIVPPPGYVPQALPPPERRLLGPASYSREFKAGPDGVITGLFRFETGSRRRLSPDEARGLRDGVVAMRKGGDLILRFTQKGEAALTAGRIGEALEEFRRLAALHPDEALHHDQMARALLRAGLGEAARAEARRGVQLQPGSAAAEKALALVLEHDLFGRQFHAGYDRAGAEAALRRARGLDPDDALVRVELAILLGYDADGQRYSPRARLDDAVREYRALESELKDSRFRANVLFPLFFVGRFDELKREARAMEASEPRNILLVAALGATTGAAAAIEEAGRLEPDVARRRSLLSQAGEKLIALRLYPEAATLFERASEGSGEGAGDASPAAARARFLRKIRRLDGNPVSREDPTWPVRELFLRVTRGQAGPAGSATTPAGLDDLFAQPSAAGDLGGGPRAFHSLFRRAFGGFSDEVLGDFIVGGMEFSAGGDKAVGYRVRVVAPGSVEPLRLFVVPSATRGRTPWVILGDGETLWPLGRHALGLARKGQESDLEAARRWLDWAREESRGGGDDPVTVHPFAQFWSRGQRGQRVEIEQAATALLVDDPASAEEAAAVLGKAREQVPAEQRYRYDLALLRAAVAAHKWSDALVHADRVAAREPDSEALFWQRFGALRRLDRVADAEALATARAARFQDDAAAQRALADNAAHRQDFPSVKRHMQRILDSGAATPGDDNQVAWTALFLSPFDRSAVDLARRAVERSGRKRPEILHTLATLQAEDGRPSEAVQTLLESLDAAHVDEPRPHDWYVLGRIAERLGIPDAARDAYRRAATSPDRALDPLSVALLADRRLAELGATPDRSPATNPDPPRADVPTGTKRPATTPAGRKSR